MRLKLSSGPASEPFMVSEARLFLRVDNNDEDTLIESLVIAARRSVENYTGLALINQTWEGWLDAFPGTKEYSGSTPWWDGTRDGPLSMLNAAASMIEISKGPLSSVTSLTTYNDADTAAVFSSGSYIVSQAGQLGRVILKTGYSWPTDLRPADAVKILFVAGYGATPSTIPEDLKLAMKQLIANWFEHREAVAPQVGTEIPLSVKLLLDPYKIIKI